MSRLSFRARVTAWYLGVLAAAAIVLAVAAWGLLHWSMTSSADAALAARVEAVGQFILSMHGALDPEDVRDEFAEYGRLTSGESLLEVIDDAGVVLCQPPASWWPALRLAEVEPEAVSTAVERVANGHVFRIAAARISVGPRWYAVTTAMSMDADYRVLTRFGWLLAGLVLAVLFVAAAGAYSISGRALAPVDQMTRAVQQITLGRLHATIEVPPANDELARLAETFNAMLARLQSAVEQIVRFTGEASHELRTPVAIIRTTAELALDRDRAPETYRQALREVVAETERMAALVDSLLSQARVDAGLEVERRTDLDLRDIVRDVIAQVSQVAQRRDLTIKPHLPATPVRVWGDPGALRRLVRVLLDNAVKYTDEGGAIEVTVDLAAGQHQYVVLRVRDDGPGIDAADAPYVFDRFYRGQVARQGTVAGSGLGLSIAQAMAERHGGTVTLAPAGHPRGCCIEVRLPVAVTGSPNLQIAKSRDRQIAESPDRQISKSLDRQIAKSPDRQIH